MPTLLDLTDEALRLHQALTAVGAMDLTDSDREQCEQLLIAQLDQVGDSLVDKVDAYGDLIRCLASEADAYDADAKLSTAKRDARRNGEKRLKESLTFALDLLGLTSVEGRRYKLALQNNPLSCGEVDEQAALAHGWAEPVTEIKVDRKAIIAAFKADPASIEGVATVTQGRSLRVR